MSADLSADNFVAPICLRRRRIPPNSRLPFADPTQRRWLCLNRRPSLCPAWPRAGRAAAPDDDRDHHHAGGDHQQQQKHLRGFGSLAKAMLTIVMVVLLIIIMVVIIEPGLTSGLTPWVVQLYAAPYGVRDATGPQSRTGRSHLGTRRLLFRAKRTSPSHDSQAPGRSAVRRARHH